MPRRRSRSACRIVGALSALVTCVGPAQAQEPDVDELVARAADYAAVFVARFSGVVAEERYTQRLVNPNTSREFVSDFLIVQIPGFDEWVSFRDVLEVDGEAVSPDSPRLVRLFLEPPSDSLLPRARAIARAGAQYNIRDIGTLNDPLRALAFVQRPYNERFRWNIVGDDADVGADVWQLRFREFVRPTFLQGNGNRDVPVTGFLWIHAPTGRVLRTELDVQRTSEIVTEFAFDEAFGVAVPVEMRERHFLRLGTNMSTVATYGRFRRFSVETSEEFSDQQ